MMNRQDEDALLGQVRRDAEAPDELLDRILASRAAGTRVVLSDGDPRRALRLPGVARIAALGAAAVILALAVPAGPTDGEDCMRTGIRKLLPVTIFGAVIACADEPAMPADSLYSPIESVEASRVLPGTFQYQTVMWTDGVVASEQGSAVSDVALLEYEGQPAWRIVTESHGRFSGVRSDTTVFSAESMDMLLYVQSRPEGRGVFQRRVFGPDSILSGYRMQDGSWSERMMPRRMEPRIMHWYGAHLRAFVAALPLREGYLGSVDDWHIRVVEQVPISVPAGNFVTWRVDVGYGTWARYKLWVDVTQPLVVKSEGGNVEDRIESVLTAYDLR